MNTNISTKKNSSISTQQDPPSAKFVQIQFQYYKEQHKYLQIPAEERIRKPELTVTVLLVKQLPTCKLKNSCEFDREIMMALPGRFSAYLI